MANGSTFGRSAEWCFSSLACSTDARENTYLYGTLNDLGARRVNEAIKSLEVVGVVVVNGRTVRQSRALERVERLRLIGV